ncbi:GNAT family N-acetyltransferase [Kitasatospora sp. NPDC059811]|uniref:GNAT family N-acetyltransferase n=1 Tax=Streptomycetaceae TaxID=2062 RepID=UPI001FCB657D|nr:GNAT family N-acetyltransferase [Streptomyces sp. MJM8645]
MKMYLDDDRSWRGRTISVRPARWYASVRLERDGYVDTLTARDEDPSLAAGFAEAAERFNDQATTRIWYDGYPGSFLSSTGARGVTLYTPFTYMESAREALRMAELHHDYAALHSLSDELALPLDDWLRPGERELVRGTDFSPPPTVFLSFLRGQASRRGLRLNGRAEAGSVWVRPTVPALQKRIREALPERYPGWVDQWTGHIDPGGTIWRPWVGGREQDLSRGAVPIGFHDAPVPSIGRCPCGFSLASGRSDTEHPSRHAQWAFGIRVPKNLEFPLALAVVTAQSPIAWRRLAGRTGRLPQRESGYDFNSWSHDIGEPEETPERFRAYLLQADEHVVGYLAAHDTDRHRWWDLVKGSAYDQPDGTRRPSIDMIWVADTYRRHGVGGTLLQALADDSGCEITDVSWSHPVTKAGQHLARRISPGGIWVS